MAKVIRCPCGLLVRGETPEETAERFAAHLRADHPEIAGQVRHDDLIAMAEEA